MEADNEKLLELLQHRLETLELIRKQLLAGQRAFTECNPQAALQHVAQQAELCDALRRLDQALMNLGVLTQPASETASVSFGALVRRLDPDSARCLRTILDRMEATRADLRRLNRTHGEFLRRSRPNTDVLLNLVVSCMGTYGPPKSMSSLALSTRNGV